MMGLVTDVALLLCTFIGVCMGMLLQADRHDKRQLQEVVHKYGKHAQRWPRETPPGPGHTKPWSRI